MKAFVYIIVNPEGKHYVGATARLAERLAEHNRGHGSTRGKGPWKLAFLEEFATLLEAKRRETEIKRKKSRQYVVALITTQHIPQTKR